MDKALATKMIHDISLVWNEKLVTKRFLIVYGKTRYEYAQIVIEKNKLLHLVGADTSLTADTFFKKSLSNELSDRGRISATAPTTVDQLSAMGTTALDVVVTIASGGRFSVTTGATFYASVLGNDAIKNGSETASFVMAVYLKNRTVLRRKVRFC